MQIEENVWASVDNLVVKRKSQFVDMTNPRGVLVGILGGGVLYGSPNPDPI